MNGGHDQTKSRCGFYSKLGYCEGVVEEFGGEVGELGGETSPPPVHETLAGHVSLLLFYTYRLPGHYCLCLLVFVSEAIPRTGQKVSLSVGPRHFLPHSSSQNTSQITYTRASRASVRGTSEAS